MPNNQRGCFLLSIAIPTLALTIYAIGLFMAGEYVKSAGTLIAVLFAVVIIGLMSSYGR